jgi:hypothetical protein
MSLSQVVAVVSSHVNFRVRWALSALAFGGLVGSRFVVGTFCGRHDYCEAVVLVVRGGDVDLDVDGFVDMVGFYVDGFENSGC